MSNVNLSTVTGWVGTVNLLSTIEVLRLSACWLPRDDNTVHSAPYSNLTRLKILDLSFNSLETSDALSLVSGVTSLKYLNLDFNFISGPLPAELGNLSSLEVLQLSSNSVTGMVPGALMNLCNLKIFELEWNFVKGDMTVSIRSNSNRFISGSYLVLVGLGVVQGNQRVGLLVVFS